MSFYVSVWWSIWRNRLVSAFLMSRLRIKMLKIVPWKLNLTCRYESHRLQSVRETLLAIQEGIFERKSDDCIGKKADSVVAIRLGAATRGRSSFNWTSFDADPQHFGGSSRQVRAKSWRRRQCSWSAYLVLKNLFFVFIILQCKYLFIFFVTTRIAFKRNLPKSIHAGQCTAVGLKIF